MKTHDLARAYVDAEVALAEAMTSEPPMPSDEQRATQRERREWLVWYERTRPVRTRRLEAAQAFADAVRSPHGSTHPTVLGPLAAEWV